MIEVIIISMLILFFGLSFFTKAKLKSGIRLPLFFSFCIFFIVSAIFTDKLYINLFFAFLAFVQSIKEVKNLFQIDDN